MAVIIQINVFSDVTSCSAVSTYHLLQEHVASVFRVDMMGAALSTERFVLLNTFHRI
jgi:hypothetical protein